MEREEIVILFEKLQKQPQSKFPVKRKRIAAPSDRHGVYVIRNPEGIVEYVGRSIRGKDALCQRLNNHLSGASTFMKKCYSGNGSILRDNFTFQFLEVDDERKRALLEYYATAWHCPKHLSLGKALGGSREP